MEPAESPEPATTDAEIRAEQARSRLRVRSPSWGAVVVVVAFILSRAAIARAGVRFDSRPLHDNWQFLELGELRSDLVGSLSHLHSQPPLFNLFVGLGLRLPDSWQVPAFRLAYLAMGLVLALCLYAVLRRLGVASPVAVALAVVVSSSPSVFLYENWFHYDYPVTLLVCLAVLALQRYEDGHRLRHAAAFLAVLAALVLTRSLFHLGWFAAWALVVVLHRRRADWRRVAAVAGVPLLAIVAVYTNVERLSGGFTSSSLLGMSLAKVTTFQLTPAERKALVIEGRLSPLALVDPYSPVARYRGLVPRHPRTGVAVLDDEAKTAADGRSLPNYNNVQYVEISKRYMDDALRTIRARPGAYAKGLATAYDIYFRPAGDFFGLGENRQKVAALERVYNVLWYGVVSGGQGGDRLPDPAVQYRQGPGRIAWTLLVAYALALVGGAWALLRGPRRDWRGPSPLVVGFLWSTLAYVMVVSTALEVGENNRFRLYTEPLLVVLLATLVVAWWRGPAPERPVSEQRCPRCGQPRPASTRPSDRATHVCETDSEVLSRRMQEANRANALLRSQLPVLGAPSRGTARERDMS